MGHADSPSRTASFPSWWPCWTRTELALGVVSEPVRDRLTYAVRSGGCWRRDGSGEARRCQVSDRAQLAGATVTVTRSSRAESSGGGGSTGRGTAAAQLLGGSETDPGGARRSGPVL